MEPIYAGGVDWVANWREVVETRRRVVEALAQQGPQHDYWQRRADRFARMARDFTLADDPLGQLILTDVHTTDTLLDVGAGTGRYTVALAPLLAHVTAVEPSSTMVEYLTRQVEQRGVANVSVITQPWEAATVPPHDIVLASHVLYPIAEVVPFLKKLDEATRRVCYLTIRVDDMVPQLTPLWHAIWGQERPREPGLLDLYNLLFALRIRPDVRLIPFGSGLGFDSLEEAVEHVRRLLFVPADERTHDSLIRKFLDAALVTQGDRLTLPNLTQAAVVWWTKRTPVDRGTTTSN